MAGGYFLGNQISNIGNSGRTEGSTNSSVLFGRVLEVCLDENTEIFDAKGNLLPIGSIKYRYVTSEKETVETESTAFPIDSNIKQLPLPNEIVVILQGPTSQIQSSVSSGTNYYSTVVNIWGSSHHNAIPEPNTDFSTILGKDTKERSDINPLYPFPGDIIIEGRQGQSVRMGGNMSAKNTLVDSSNNGMPVILISNGQIVTDNGIDHIVEDINKDPNSLYFVSDHMIPLLPANKLQNSYDTPPISTDKYIGNQVLLNAGRVVINAKKENILLSAKESIGLNGDSLNFDATKYFCVDSKKIYLGKAARTAAVKEPVILGAQLENWLNTLLDSLESVSVGLTQATSVTGGPVTQLNVIGPELNAIVKILRTQITQFQSKKVYTE